MECCGACGGQPSSNKNAAKSVAQTEPKNTATPTEEKQPGSEIVNQYQPKNSTLSQHG